MNTLKTIILFTIILASSYQVKAQTLVLNLVSGQTENYPVENIRSIKFPDNHMVINQNDGTLISIPIPSITSYEFNPSSLDNNGMQAIGNLLSIYPNPTSERVQIVYSGLVASSIEIEILDSSGRLLNRLYKGAHSGETSTEWNPRAESVAAGQYLCRVNAGEKVVIAKIIVQ